MIDPTAARESRLRSILKALSYRLTGTVTTVALQMAELFTAAVLSAWHPGALSPPRKRLQARMAEHLGWKDLRTASRPEETKFNVQPGRPRERLHDAVSLPAQLSLFDQPRSSRRPA